MGKYKVTFKMTAYAEVIVEADNESEADEKACSELDVSCLIHIKQQHHGTSLTIMGGENTLSIETDDVEIESTEKL